ncbi:MAG: hypothetical protein ACFFD4_13325 [Candidatus Odinarchaeota archaeon]
MSDLTTVPTQEMRKAGLSHDVKGKLIQRKSDRVVELLELNGPLTRKDIMSLSGYAWSTIYDILARLEMKGKVNRYSQRIQRGRPRVFWRIKNF